MGKIIAGPPLKSRLVTVPFPRSIWGQAQITVRIETEGSQLDIAITVATVFVITVPQVKHRAGRGNEPALRCV